MADAAKPRAIKRNAAQAEAFRDHLIGIARAMFAEEGFDAVSIRKIAQRAGCPTMTFYVFFKSKRALLRHIWDDVFTAMFDQCQPVLSADLPPAARLEALIRAIIAFWLDRPDSYRLVFMNQDEADPEHDDFYVQSSAIGDRFQIIAQIIGEGIANGEFRNRQIEGAVQAVLATMIGVAHALVTIPEFPWDRQALIDQAVHGVLSGLRVPPAAATGLTA